MSITSTVDTQNKTLTIMVKGRFDFSALHHFKECYESLDEPIETYHVDLREADYLDSSALGMLLALRDHAGGEKHSVKILNAKPDVKKILLVTKLDELFDMD